MPGSCGCFGLGRKATTIPDRPTATLASRVPTTFGSIKLVASCSRAGNDPTETDNRLASGQI